MKQTTLRLVLGVGIILSHKIKFVSNPLISGKRFSPMTLLSGEIQTTHFFITISNFNALKRNEGLRYAPNSLE